MVIRDRETKESPDTTPVKISVYIKKVVVVVVPYRSSNRLSSQARPCGPEEWWWLVPRQLNWMNGWRHYMCVLLATEKCFGLAILVPDITGRLLAAISRSPIPLGAQI